MTRRRPDPNPEPPATLALVALVAARGGPPDRELVELLLTIRQANVIANRAIEDYLGLGPARSERARPGRAH